MTHTLPTDAKERKNVPLYSGFVRYFPDAMVEVAIVSKIGNDQHNPGQPLHWSKHKSRDHGDCILRHQVDVGTRDSDGVRHAAKVAWRAMAQLQIEIEAERAGLSVADYLNKLEAAAVEARKQAQQEEQKKQARAQAQARRKVKFGDTIYFQSEILRVDDPTRFVERGEDGSVNVVDMRGVITYFTPTLSDLDADMTGPRPMYSFEPPK